jgi:hypothetical protein
MPRKISPLAERALGLRGVGNNSSSVTAGKRMFVDFGDARSAWAKRWADLITAHASDLGGPEVLSEAQLSICRRAAAIECELEGLEGRMSASQPIDIGVYARLRGVLCRLLELVGIKRLTKPLDPQSELVKAMAAYAGTPVDDDDDGDEPLPIELGSRARRGVVWPRSAHTIKPH